MIARTCNVFVALLAFLVLAVFPAHANAQTATANWSDLGIGSLNGVPSGSTVTASDGTSVTVQHGSETNGGTFAPTYGGSFVAYYAGTIGSATNVLLGNFDNSNYDPADRVIIDITLGRSVTNLQFKLTDIDNGGFQDAVAVLYDTGSGTFQNAASTASFYTANAGVTRTNNATINGWTGTQNSAQTETTGDLAFHFGNTAVIRIRIVYSSYTGIGDPGAQYMGMSALTFAAPGADLSLAKGLSSGNPSAGGTASWTLTVASSSLSSATATGIEVRDVLPSGFNFTAASGSGTYNATTGVWSVGSLAPGATATITITGTVSASSGATITNSAEIIASSLPDPDSTPNNGAAGEDDYATASLTVTGTRTAGTPPALTCPAGSTIFDWDMRTWAAGSTANSYPLDAIGQIGFTLQNPGVWVSIAAFGGQSPLRQSVVNGGTGEFALSEVVNLANRTDAVTSTISLPAIMRGAQFTIFDVDYAAGQFADRVQVTGRYQGATVVPVLTNGAANYIIGNEAFGDGASADAQANGNVVVTFTQPIDTIVVAYGNHALAPANPGQQGIAIHDITLCRPTTTITSIKTSTVISDPISGPTQPKAIPGALVRYCVTTRNTGDTSAVNVVGSDALPANVTYVPGSLKSGASCAAAATVEDDDAAGGDETDPLGASVAGATVRMSASTLAAGGAFAVTFDTTVR